MKTTTRFPLLRLALAGAAWGGCTRTAPFKTQGEFVQATPIADDAPEPEVAAGPSPGVEHVVRTSIARDEGASPGETERVSRRPGPSVARALVPKKRPANAKAVVAQANARAAQSPGEDGYFNAVMTYTYMPGGLYEIYTATMRVTDIVLEPGEEIVGQPAAGDVVRWVLALGSSVNDGVPQQHVFVKPTRPGLSTNLTLNTTRRTYFLNLESWEDTYMVAVKWNYPHTEAHGLSAETSRGASDARTASPTDVRDLYFDYAIAVIAGKPTWKPERVFDDGKKTFIQFPKRMLNAESPALFVTHGDELQIVNFRVRKNLYIVDRIFNTAELRLGQQDQDVVRITRK